MNTEHEIDALLSRDETGSIIDRLMALPRSAGAAQGANEWDRAGQRPKGVMQNG